MRVTNKEYVILRSRPENREPCKRFAQLRWEEEHGNSLFPLFVRVITQYHINVSSYCSREITDRVIVGTDYQERIGGREGGKRNYLVYRFIGPILHTGLERKQRIFKRCEGLSDPIHIENLG
ncbi:hypothetical protein TNCT_432591 [Trichonephila clavata]|uniref:Uncharacterized protein n=1 Tax=Trichonephila clavata TaxID=2740835 RepID=A0A8X6K9Y1_TRICU|nr:hypothetical protein TNCT_432591 [Trichonephila clavata]